MLVPFVSVIERARPCTGQRADACSLSSSGNRPNRSAAGGSNRHAFGGSHVTFMT